MDVTVFEIVMVSLVGILMGAMGAIIGSTLLILVPLLSLLGLPIQTAIGTAKVSVISREIVPAVYFYGKKLVKPGIAIPFSITAIIASYAGSVVAVHLNAAILEKIVAVCMFLISAIMIINPQIGLHEKVIAAAPLHVLISLLLGVFVGFYTGVFGGGANVFIIFGFILIFGHTFLQATANSKLPNLIITAASIPMFVINGFVHWQIAVPLTLCTAIGAHFGAKLAFHKGNKFIRALFVGLVVVLALKYML
ncbi:MAG: sulfite exporter TauE/SafE family protein [Desulfobacterales bacterium]|nr:MAG: sulfite exporter TauE/SafE family protein [Desulfobacterales bacterium]